MRAVEQRTKLRSDPSRESAQLRAVHACRALVDSDKHATLLAVWDIIMIFTEIVLIISRLLITMHH